jgi:hypothetical protein
MASWIFQPVRNECIRKAGFAGRRAPRVSVTPHRGREALRAQLAEAAQQLIFEGGIDV